VLFKPLLITTDDVKSDKARERDIEEVEKETAVE
jgi:hypothetical protein